MKTKIRASVRRPIDELICRPGHVQVLLNMLRGFTAQAALDAPRFCISAGSPDSEVRGSEEKAGDINSEVYFEEGVPESTVTKLRGEY